jgi:6-phosphogluconolactonase
MVSVVLSGGNTPKLFFQNLLHLVSNSPGKPNWNKIHIFWGDERCVPPFHPDSNFGMTNKILLRDLPIPEENIHRIKGENDPASEASRYSEEIRKHVPTRNNYPFFDWVFLGLGEDGHIASIFPDQLNFLYSEKDCEVAIHPETGQKRITLTGNVLINADRVTFLISGHKKKRIVYEIFTNKPTSKAYPAYFIKPLSGKIDWYIDQQAAALIK